MIPPISPLMHPALNPDIKYKYFSFLSPSELCKIAAVSKEWLKLSCHNHLWIPLFKELSPLAEVEFKENAAKSKVISHLLDHQTTADKILDACATDAVLSTFHEDSSLSLSALKKMLPIERSLYTLRIFSKQFNQLLTFLSYRHGTLVTRHQEESISVPLFLKLIEKPIGLFDAEKALFAALQMNLLPANRPTVMQICALILKSRPKLSEIFTQKYDIGDEISGSIYVPMAQALREVVIPQIQEVCPEVTIKDWIACGLPTT